MRIPHADVEPYIPDGVGQQVHVNHTSCPAGTDTRRRLYIKREHDKVLAYCHNCNGHYVRSERGVRSVALIERLLAKEVESPTAKEVQLPHDIDYNPATWPAAATAWLYGHRFDNRMIQDYSLGYSPSWGRVVLPVFESGKCIFWQGRRIEGDGPKYISVRSAKKPLFMACDPRIPVGTAVVVEDMLSAIRVAESLPGRMGVALLGTHEPSQLTELLNSYKAERVLVWLDDDEPGRMKAGPLSDRLALCCKMGVHAVWEKEPKRMSNYEIDGVILDVLS